MNKNAISLTIFVLVASVLIYFAVNSTLRDEQKVAVALIELLKSENNPEQFEDIAFFSYPNLCSGNLEEMPIKQDGIHRNHIEANINASPVRLVALEGKVRLVSWEDNWDLWKTKLVALKFKENPKHLIGLSRVGFSDDSKTAMICFETWLVGKYYIFEKIDKKWELSSFSRAWIK